MHRGHGVNLCTIPISVHGFLKQVDNGWFTTLDQPKIVLWVLNSYSGWVLRAVDSGDFLHLVIPISSPHALLKASLWKAGLFKNAQLLMRSEGFWAAPRHLSCHNESHSQDILMWLTINGGFKAQIQGLLMVGKCSTTKSIALFSSG